MTIYVDFEDEIECPKCEGYKVECKPSLRDEKILYCQCQNLDCEEHFTAILND